MALGDGIARDPAGNRIWFSNGFPNRDDGPAIEERSGTKYWVRDGRILFFEDGEGRHSAGRQIFTPPDRRYGTTWYDRTGSSLR